MSGLGLAVSMLVNVVASGPFRVPVPPESVVASAIDVDGRVEITAERLARYCADHPSLSPRAAAEDLVLFELLAREAMRRGLAATDDVRRATAAAAVPRLLKQTFEPGADATTIPRGTVQRAYERNLGMFVRPELRSADHILVGTPEFKPFASPEAEEAARRLADRIASQLRASPPGDAAAFRATGEAFKVEGERAGLGVKVETISPFPLEGPLVRPFSEATFALQAPGQISAPVLTAFGFHVIRLEGVEPALNRSFAEAEAEIRERLLVDHRLQRFRHATDALLDATGAAVDLSLLEEPGKKTP